MHEQFSPAAPRKIRHAATFDPHHDLGRCGIAATRCATRFSDNPQRPLPRRYWISAAVADVAALFGTASKREGLASGFRGAKRGTRRWPQAAANGGNLREVGERLLKYQQIRRRGRTTLGATEGTARRHSFLAGDLHIYVYGYTAAGSKILFYLGFSVKSDRSGATLDWNVLPIRTDQ